MNEQEYRADVWRYAVARAEQEAMRYIAPVPGGMLKNESVEDYAKRSLSHLD